VSAEAKKRAEVVGNLPHVRAWVKRFKKLSKEMPPEVWVYVAASTPTVMALREDDGKWFQSPVSDGADADAIVDRASGGHWDGGDW